MLGNKGLSHLGAGFCSCETYHCCLPKTCRLLKTLWFSQSSYKNVFIPFYSSLLPQQVSKGEKYKGPSSEISISNPSKWSPQSISSWSSAQKRPSRHSTATSSTHPPQSQPLSSHLRWWTVSSLRTSSLAWRILILPGEPLTRVDAHICRTPSLVHTSWDDGCYVEDNTDHCKRSIFKADRLQEHRQSHSPGT